jgi:hypothetical protein
LQFHLCLSRKRLEEWVAAEQAVVLRVARVELQPERVVLQARVQEQLQDLVV